MGNRQPFIVAQRGRNPENPKSRVSGLVTEQILEPNFSGVSNTLTSVEKDNYVFDPYNETIPKDQNATTTLRTNHTNGNPQIISSGSVRKLMPIECERLMSWPDNHTKYGMTENGETVEISDSQRYKMCGNRVVSEVVKHLAKHLL